MLRSFASGWCTAGNHSHCRGAARRPNDDQGNEQVWYCNCKCHKGQDVQVPEIVKPRFKPGSRNPEQLKEWTLKFKAYGKLSVELPDTDEELEAFKRRMHSAAKKAGISVQLELKGGKLVATKKTTRRRAKKG